MHGISFIRNSFPFSFTPLQIGEKLAKEVSGMSATASDCVTQNGYRYYESRPYLAITGTMFSIVYFFNRQLRNSKITSLNK